MDNTITVVGTLGRDPEIKFTNGGGAKASWSMAVTRRWKDQSGEQQEQTSWVNVVAWGQLAENCAASLAKGNRVIVSGRLEQRSYEKDGEKKDWVEVVADAVGPDLRFATAEVVRAERREAVDY